MLYAVHRFPHSIMSASSVHIGLADSENGLVSKDTLIAKMNDDVNARLKIVKMAIEN